MLSAKTRVKAKNGNAAVAPTTCRLTYVTGDKSAMGATTGEILEAHKMGVKTNSI